jgi:hypothetical protein
MFLSHSLSIALINVSCKSNYYIVRLMPSVRDCHLDGDDCALEQEHRTRGWGDEETTRKGWDRRKGVECAEERWTLWGETCSATRRRVVVLKESDVEKGLNPQRGRWVFDNLTGSNVDEKDKREVRRAGRWLPFKWNWGLHFWDAHGLAGNRK